LLLSLVALLALTPESSAQTSDKLALKQLRAELGLSFKEFKEQLKVARKALLQQVQAAQDAAVASGSLAGPGPLLEVFEDFAAFKDDVLEARDEVESQVFDDLNDTIMELSPGAAGLGLLPVGFVRGDSGALDRFLAKVAKLEAATHRALARRIAKFVKVVQKETGVRITYHLEPPSPIRGEAAFGAMKVTFSESESRLDVVAAASPDLSGDDDQIRMFVSGSSSRDSVVVRLLGTPPLPPHVELSPESGRFAVTFGGVRDGLRRGAFLIEVGSDESGSNVFSQLSLGIR